MRYMDFSCLKPLHLIGSGCGGGSGAGLGVFFLLRWRFTGRLQSSGNRISWEPYMGHRWAVDGAAVLLLAPHALALAAAGCMRHSSMRARAQGGAAGRRGPTRLY